MSLDSDETTIPRVRTQMQSINKCLQYVEPDLLNPCLSASSGLLHSMALRRDPETFAHVTAKSRSSGSSTLYAKSPRTESICSHV